MFNALFTTIGIDLALSLNFEHLIEGWVKVLHIDVIAFDLVNNQAIW